MLLGGDFTSGHALCVSMMALSSGAFTKGTVLGPIPWKVELGLVFSNCPLPAHQVVQTSPKFQPGRQPEAHVPSVPTGRDTRTWKPRVAEAASALPPALCCPPVHCPALAYSQQSAPVSLSEVPGA